MSTAGTTPDRTVPDLLSNHDALCPACGYCLRGLARAVCPECGGRLDLPVEPDKPRPAFKKAMIAAVAWGIFGAGVVGTRAMMWPERSVGGVRHGPDPLSIGAVVIAAIGVLTLAAWVFAPAWWRGLADHTLTRLKWCAWAGVGLLVWETALRP